MQVLLETNLDHISMEEWDALVLRSPTRTIFQTYSWHRAWWQTVARHQDLFLIVVRNQTQIMGIAPLCIFQKGRLKILKFMATGQADYCDFLYDQHQPDILRQIFAFLKTKKDMWDAAAFDYIPQESVSGSFLSQVKGWRSRLYAKHPCPAFVFKKDKGNLEMLLQKKSLKRHAHYFESKKNFAVKHLTETSLIKPYLDLFFEQHIKRRKMARTESLFQDEKYRQFYRALVDELSSRKNVIFTVIESESSPIAFHFGFLFQGRFMWYKPSFDPALAKHSPGEVLLKELLTHAATLNCQEFDFTIGDEAFKSRFANHVRHSVSYKIFKQGIHDWTDRIVNTSKQWMGR